MKGSRGPPPTMSFIISYSINVFSMEVTFIFPPLDLPTFPPAFSSTVTTKSMTSLIAFLRSS